MKVSRYNIIHITDDNVSYVYNSLSGALAKTDDNFARLIEYVSMKKEIQKLSKEDTELLYRMEKAGFVVDDSLNEIEKYKEFQENQKNYMETINAVIAPTMNCNFACKYCFENQNTHIMSDGIKGAIIKFLSNQIIKNSTKKFSLIWFGGEPLLQKDIIYDISAKFIKFCKNNNIIFDSKIVTNGYLIDDSTAINLSKCKIKSAQITVDGTELVHNKRRIYKDNDLSERGTYNKIIENINILIRNNIKVDIRMNVDMENDHNIDAFVREMASVISRKDMVSINLGYVSNSCDSANEYKQILTLQDFAPLKINLFKLLQEYNFDRILKNGFPKLKASYCGACRGNSFVIDPDGYIYRCWEDISHIQCNIGNVYDFDDISSISGNRRKWIEYSPHDNEQCIDCNVLPICGGGCPRELIHFGKNTRCDAVKHNITSLIEFYALYNLNKKEIGYGTDN